MTIIRITVAALPKCVFFFFKTLNNLLLPPTQISRGSENPLLQNVVGMLVCWTKYVYLLTEGQPDSSNDPLY